MAAIKPRRTKEENAALKAAAAKKRAARVAKMLGACATRVGLPCPHGCTVGCKRNKLQRNASKARISRSRTARDAMAASVEHRQAELKKQEKDRIAALRFVEKKRRSQNAALEKWKAQVLFLIGYGSADIADMVYGASARRKEIDRLIRTFGLRPAILDWAVRIEKLIDLDAKAPKGYEGYVDGLAAHGPTKGLHADIVRIRGTVPELIVLQEHTRAGERIWNAGSSALQVVARGGIIQEWNVQAGLKLHALFVLIPGGSIGGGLRELIDGGVGDRDMRMAKGVDAAKAVSEARGAVMSAFHIQGTAAWRWAIIDHVVLQDRPLKEFDLPVGMTASAALFLNDALEPVAILLKTAPAGVSLRQPSREDWARFELTKAMQAHREAKMAR